jgi:monothiol glutaredoxin
MENETKSKIEKIISDNDVVLFMKGSAQMPQCGFSSRIAGILNFLDLKFMDVNVLEDDTIRQGIKDYSDWPTIPQLYVKKEFIGGSDIITEMTMSGELDKLFSEKDINFSKTAANKIREENA